MHPFSLVNTIGYRGCNIKEVEDVLNMEQYEEELIKESRRQAAEYLEELLD